MGERYLPARKGREVRGLETHLDRSRRGASSVGGNEPPSPPAGGRRYSPHPSGGGRDVIVAGAPSVSGGRARSGLRRRRRWRRGRGWGELAEGYVDHVAGEDDGPYLGELGDDEAVLGLILYRFGGR
jgi:hypothetical protein